MKLILSVWVIFLAFSLVTFAEDQTASTIVLRAARMWDARSSTAVTNGAVVIENGKIIKFGSAADVPANAKVIDLGDVTLLPGFIDLHGSLHQQRDSYPLRNSRMSSLITFLWVWHIPWGSPGYTFSVEPLTIFVARTDEAGSGTT